MPTVIRPGETLADRYRLDDLLSESGSGRFWRAHDHVLQRAVALHVISAADERATGLLDAARRSAAVVDPRILRVLDAQLRSDVCFVVNEWGAGTSLDIALASNGPLVPRRAAWLVGEVADSLAVAHAHGVHHGRLVPENVLIDSTGNIRIIGLGVDAAMHGLPPGDEAGDVRDLAGLLYAALCGRWAGDSSSAVPPAPQDGGHVLRPRQVRAGVPRPLDDLADELLNPDGGRARGDRDLGSASAVAAHLSDVVGDPAGIAEALAAANPTRAPEPVVLEQVPDFALQPPPPEPVVVGETPPGLFSDEATAPGEGGGSEATDRTSDQANPHHRTGSRENHARHETTTEPKNGFQHGSRLQAAARAVAAGTTPTVGPSGSVALHDVETTGAPASEATVDTPHHTSPVAHESHVDPDLDEAALPEAELDRDRADVAAELALPDLADDPADDTGHADAETTTAPRRGLAGIPPWLRLTVLGALMMVLLSAFALASRGGGTTDVPDIAAGRPVPTGEGGPVLAGLTVQLFDPGGTPGAGATNVKKAVDGDPATTWVTGTFTEQFSTTGDRAGLGIVIDTGTRQEITRVDLTFAGEPTRVAVYVTSQLPEAVSTLRSMRDLYARTQETVDVPADTTGRYVLVYLTELPQVGVRYEGGLTEITVRG